MSATDQPGLFDPGPAVAPPPDPIAAAMTGDDWDRAYRTQRDRTATGIVGMDISPDAERRARRRFARRHGLGADWIDGGSGR